MAMCQAELWIPHTYPLHHMCAYSSSRHHIREDSCTIHLSASQMCRNHSKETKETREADPNPPCHPKRHPPFSYSWVINYQCLRSLETKTLLWKKSVSTLNASVRAKTMIKKNTNLALILARRGKEERRSMAENALNARAAWSWDVKNYDKVNQRPLLPLPKRLRSLRETTFYKTNYLFWIKGVRLSRGSPLKQGQIQFAITPLSNNISNCCHFHLRQ